MEENNKYHFKTTEVDVYFNKDLNDTSKYVVCTCARNENDYIIEFVEHYLRLGFDKILICDNNDDNSIETVLSRYIDSGQVEIFDCRGFNSFQVQFYSMFLREGNYKWCGYFDADEFLELGIHDNIKQFLDGIQEDCVSFNWLVFADNGQLHKEDGLLRDRFTMPVRPVSMFKENCFVKSIVRGGCDTFKNGWFNGSHIPVCEDHPVKYNLGGYCIVDYQSHTHFPPRYKYGYIRHYYTKSFDEWIIKSNRGWPDGTVSLNSANYFICNTEGDAKVPIDRFTTGFFIGNGGKSKISQSCCNIIRDYTVINVINGNKNVYAFIVELTELMDSTTDHAFVISDEHITDDLFDILLEYAFVTGNKLVYAKDDNEKWQAYLKFNHGENTYYILNLL